MWTIDRLDGMMRTKTIMEEMIEDADALDLLFPPGEVEETSGGLGTEQIGWVICGICQESIPSRWLGKGIHQCHSPSSPPSTPTPPTQLGVPAEHETSLEQDSLARSKRLQNHLNFLFKSRPSTPDTSETSLVPCETEDLLTGFYQAPSSHSFTTTTSIPLWTGWYGYTPSENPMPSDGDDGLGRNEVDDEC